MGMSARRGMRTASKCPGVLSPAGSKTRRFRKRVAPTARILITVPPMI